MKRLTTLAALGAMSTLVLLGAPSAEARSGSTDKKTTKKVVVTVKAGDTLSAIAKKHKTTYVRLFNANKQIANPDMIDVGDKVRIPAKKEKLKNRMATLTQAQATPVQSSAAAAYPAQSTSSAPTGYVVRGSSSGNTYYQGYCTWYAKERRPDLPNMLGNGGQWTANAAAQGFKTGTTARAGAIAETPGHVMYVEKVYGDGTMLISEMNGSAGFGNVGSRRVPTSGHSFIY
jgi:surface antigen